MLKPLIFSGSSDDDVKHDLGGKAHHLIQMKKAGLNVPMFFVLPGETVAYIIDPIKKDIASLLSNIKVAVDPQLFSASQKIKEKILSLNFSVDLENDILRACISHFGEKYFVSVRSSAESEDGTNASFAGQHESFLFVTPIELIQKIKACIASAWSFGALSYRLAQGISIFNIKYAVIIQQMIAAKKSGVSFSMNLNGNLADSVIVAGYGLGEGIVQDRVETDTYTIDRQHQTLAKKCVKKHFQVIYKEEEGLIDFPLDSSLQDTQVLTDEEIIQVFNLTMKTEKLLNHPSDIEFSFDKNGLLYILQMRPITTLNLSKIEILDNTNIVESYPGITLPLSFSFALDAYEKVFKGSSKAFWVSKSTIQKNELIFKNLLAHYYGRIYYRLDNWYKMLSLVHSSSSSMAAWEKAVGLTNSESEKIPFTFQKKVKMFFSIVYLILNYRRGNKQFFRIFNKNYKFLKAFKSFSKSPELLWQHYETATAKLFNPWYITLVNDFLAFKFFGWLQDLVSKFNLSKSESIANDLLCGIGGVESEEAILNVLNLKEKILQDPGLTTLFTKPDEDILSDLETIRFSSFNKLFQHHLEQYGDRTLSELKLETPSLRNQPLFFIQLLKNQLATTISIKDFKKHQKAIRANAEITVNSHLKWWNPKTYVFKFVRSMATYGLKSRENMRFCRTRGYGAVKDIFIAIGELMVKFNIIENVNDVFYLSVDELKAFCKNGNRDTKTKHVENLKREYTFFETLHLPDRVIYPKDELPVMTNDWDLKKSHVGLNHGIAVSKGIVSAEAIVINNPAPQMSVHGKILISKMTDPGWVFLMMQAVGLVSEKGSLLSHTAIVGRELGIPVVVGLKDATSIFKSGDMLKLDGSAGTVEFVK